MFHDFVLLTIEDNHHYDKKYYLMFQLIQHVIVNNVLFDFVLDVEELDINIQDYSQNQIDYNKEDDFILKSSFM